METDSISRLSYWLHSVIAWITHWITSLRGIYASYSTEIQIAICIIIGSIVLIVILVLAMLRRTYKEWQEKKSMNKIKDYLEDVVKAIVWEDDAPDLTMDEITIMVKEHAPDVQNLLKTKRDKRLFCRLVYDYLITDKGELCNVNNLHKLLELFDMRRFLELEMDHGKMKRKVYSMNMMNIFRLNINPWLINTILQSKSPQVCRQAMYSSAMSGVESNLDYFESEFFDKNSCMKDEIELGYALQRRKKAGLDLPNLARLAHFHKNAKTQCIFVRLMNRFKQTDYCYQLEDLFVNSRNKTLTAEIATTWGFLDYKAGEPLMIEALPTQSDQTKISLMQALARLRTGHAIDVLAGGFTNTVNPELRLEALRCLYNYGVEGRKLFDQMEENRKDKDKTYFEFFHKEITQKYITLESNLDYTPKQSTVYHWFEKN